MSTTTVAILKSATDSVHIDKEHKGYSVSCTCGALLDSADTYGLASAIADLHAEVHI